MSIGVECHTWHIVLLLPHSHKYKHHSSICETKFVREVVEAAVVVVEYVMAQVFHIWHI